KTQRVSALQHRSVVADLPDLGIAPLLLERDFGIRYRGNCDEKVLGLGRAVEFGVAELEPASDLVRDIAADEPVMRRRDEVSVSVLEGEWDGGESAVIHVRPLIELVTVAVDDVEALLGVQLVVKAGCDGFAILILSPVQK